jgi:hypothetical protein
MREYLLSLYVSDKWRWDRRVCATSQEQAMQKADIDEYAPVCNWERKAIDAMVCDNLYLGILELPKVNNNA